MRCLGCASPCAAGPSKMMRRRPGQGMVWQPLSSWDPRTRRSSLEPTAELVALIQKYSLQNELTELQRILDDAPKGSLGQWKCFNLSQALWNAQIHSKFQRQGVDVYLVREARFMGAQKKSLCFVDRSVTAAVPENIYNDAAYVMSASGKRIILSPGVDFRPGVFGQPLLPTQAISSARGGDADLPHPPMLTFDYPRVAITQLLQAKGATALDGEFRSEMESLPWPIDVGGNSQTSYVLTAIANCFRVRFSEFGIAVWFCQECEPPETRNGSAEDTEQSRSYNRWIVYADLDKVPKLESVGGIGWRGYLPNHIHGKSGFQGLHRSSQAASRSFDHAQIAEWARFGFGFEPKPDVDHNLLASMLNRTSGAQIRGNGVIDAAANALSAGLIR